MALIGGFNDDDFYDDLDDRSLLMGKRFDNNDFESYNGSLINSFDKNELNDLELLSNEESVKQMDKRNK